MKWLSLSVFMVDLRRPFISFIFEKLLSDSAFEAGRTNINSIICKVHSIDLKLEMHIFWKIQWYHQNQDYPSFWIFNIFIYEYIYNFFVFKLVIKRLVIDGSIFFFTEWSYSGSFCEKFDNLGWKKLLMAFCLGILCKNVHLFNVFSLILFMQIVSILRA